MSILRVLEESYGVNKDPEFEEELAELKDQREDLESFNKEREPLTEDTIRAIRDWVIYVNKKGELVFGDEARAIEADSKFWMLSSLIGTDDVLLSRETILIKAIMAIPHDREIDLHEEADRIMRSLPLCLIGNPEEFKEKLEGCLITAFSIKENHREKAMEALKVSKAWNYVFCHVY